MTTIKNNENHEVINYNYLQINKINNHIHT